MRLRPQKIKRQDSKWSTMQAAVGRQERSRWDAFKKREVAGGERLRMRYTKGARRGDSRTLRPRLPCRQRAGAESCMSSHWATGRSLSTWSGAGGGRRSGEGRIALEFGPGPAVAGAGAGSEAGWGPGVRGGRKLKREEK